jgi:hypothetical protein
MSFTCVNPSCDVTLEERRHPTKEQAEQGTWYDHPPTAFSMIGHTSSVLVPSDEMQAVLAAAAGKAVKA